MLSLKRLPSIFVGLIGLIPVTTLGQVVLENSVTSFVPTAANGGGVVGTVEGFDPMGGSKLIVAVTGEARGAGDDINVSSITFNGVELTAIPGAVGATAASPGDTTLQYSGIYQLDFPAKVPGDIVVNWSRLTNGAGIAVLSVSGTPDTFPSVANVIEDSNTLGFTTTENSSFVFASFVANGGPTAAGAGDGVTTIGAGDIGSAVAGFSTQVVDTASTFTIEFTGGGNRPTLAAIALAPGEFIDTDEDGLPDSFENRFAGLNPLDPNDGPADADGDNLSNATEFSDGTNLFERDTDSDGLDDDQEKIAGTSPFDSDSDNDLYTDGVEVTATTNPLDDTSFPINNLGLFVDFSSAPVNGQTVYHDPLYQAYLATHETNTGDFPVPNLRDYTVPAFGDASVSLEVTFVDETDFPYDTATVMQLLSRDNVDSYLGTMPSLMRDWIGIDPREANGGGGSPDNGGLFTIMNFTFEGLPAGTYRYRSYHHDVADLNSAFEIRLTDSELSAQSLGTFRQTHGTAGNPILFSYPTTSSADGIAPSELSSTIEFVIKSDGSTPVVISYVATEALVPDPDNDGEFLTDTLNSIVAVNGFEIIETTDTDGDRIPDDADLQPTIADADTSADSDSLTNLREYHLGTLLNNEDSDGDGLNDDVELGTKAFVDAGNTGTSPFFADSDGDGALDGAEVLASSNPLDATDTPAPTTPPLIGAVTLAGDQLTITWTDSPVGSYSIFASDNLETALDTGTPIATGITTLETTLTIDTSTQSKRFYVITRE